MFPEPQAGFTRIAAVSAQGWLPLTAQRCYALEIAFFAPLEI